MTVQNMRRMTWELLTLISACAVTGWAGLPEDLPDRGGLVVLVDIDDPADVLPLGKNGRRIVHALDRNEAMVAKARRLIRESSLYGRLSADTWTGEKLPHASNTVRLLVAGKDNGVSQDETIRVLCPGGTAYIRQENGWREIVKPVPDEIDEWTHGEYDASNHTVSSDTVVGPPRSIQWIGAPKWTRQHEAMTSFTTMVSAGGRVFYIVDEGPKAAVEAPAQWVLAARDAYSGVTLWKKDIPRWVTHYWPWKAGPSSIVRRLVAVGEELYAPLAIDANVAALKAATGEQLRQYPGSAGAEEMLWIDGTLVVLTAPEMEDPQKTEAKYLAARRKNKVWEKGGNPQVRADIDRHRILAYNAASGEEIWRIDSAVVPMTMAAKDGKVVFHDGEELRCASLSTGEEIWITPAPMKKYIGQRFWVDVTPTLALYEDLVLFAWYGTVSVYSLDAGKKQWDGPFPKRDYASPVSCYVVDDQLWRLSISHHKEKSEMIGFDPWTGEERTRFKRDGRFGRDGRYGLVHHRCHKTRATEKYLLTGMFGIEFVDPVEQTYTDQTWVRGACTYGFMPANGLVYMPPHSCACNVEEKLNGFFAFSPEEHNPEDYSPRETVRGPAFGVTGSDQAPAGQWPVYRHDAARSGAVDTVLPASLSRRWSAKLGAHSTAPVVANGAVLVAQPDRFRVLCLDAKEGTERWRFSASSRVDSTPTIDGNRVIFGSTDGCVYCLRLSDGVLAWKTQVAPGQRLIVVRERLESAWPVNGSLLVRDGVVYAVVGRSPYTDGGMQLVRLDADSGEILSDNPLTGEKLNDSDIPLGSDYHHGALQDLLVAMDDELFMRHLNFDPDGKLTQSRTPHLFSAAGFLDTQWHYRHYWSFGTWKVHKQCGFANWTEAFNHRIPSGRIMAFDGTHVFAFGRDRIPRGNYHQFMSGEKYKLSRFPQARNWKQETSKADWRKSPPFHAFALLLAKQQTSNGNRDVVVMAGPEGDTLTSMDALEGRSGGRLLVAERKTGQFLVQQDLGDAVPVIDGMAAADGRLYMTTKDNRLLCLGQ